MPNEHELIHLGDKTWDESRMLIEHELNRAATNVHNVRDDAHASDLALSVRVTAVEVLIASLSTRIAVLEVKFGLYAILGGALGSLAMSWILKKI